MPFLGKILEYAETLQRQVSSWKQIIQTHFTLVSGPGLGQKLSPWILIGGMYPYYSSLSFQQFPIPSAMFSFSGVCQSLKLAGMYSTIAAPSSSQGLEAGIEKQFLFPKAFGL